MMDKNINDLFRLAQEYKPQSVGVEVTGQQGGFIQWIQGEMLTRNIWFSLASEGNGNQAGVRPVSNKMVRFNTVVPWFKQGIVFLPEEYRGSHELVIEMEDELVSASKEGFKSKHDDVIDTISMLSVLKPWKPSEEPRMTKDDSGIWEDSLIYEEDDGHLGSYIV
jgi:predicted phage terminase large subunit-like protein